ncbi:Pre-rRNA-processing protein esf1 [Smittium culicis]|uniref:Pre-rRNA-processing protein esf1 n=2 Tax=Smittium culicis TaxID=133412 RepID=A0A1R1Y352_9FUNG|nr:Pre-rRNA-processing protein esf1 [Smittium culicis]
MSGEKSKITDSRFSVVEKDPRFVRPSRRRNKVIVDERFSNRLDGSEFMQKVDKYGRKKKDSKLEKQLKRFYVYDKKSKDENKEKSNGSDESSSEDSDLEAELSSESDSDSDSDASQSSNSDGSSNIKSGTKKSSVSNALKNKRIIDRARGEAISDESSESDSDDSLSEQDELNVADIYDSSKAATTEVHSNRLAIVNMDWENIRAVDLLAAFTAYKPSIGSIINIKIYMSDFGKERISQETKMGPPSNIYLSDSEESTDVDSSDNDSDAASDKSADEAKTKTKTKTKERKLPVEYEEGKDFDQAALRKYELEKLRYYYAIATCDSVSTAESIYESIDSTEFESSANLFDLRFVPDDTSFEDNEPVDVASKIPENYKPVDFVTTVLQHSQVKLTWDLDDPKRMDLKKKTFMNADLDLIDYKSFIASSDDSGESEGENLGGSKKSKKSSKKDIAAKYRELLLGGTDEDNSVFGRKSRRDNDSDSDGEVDMEITFAPGLSNKSFSSSKGIIEDFDDSIPVPENETTLEKYVRKQKERRMKKALSKSKNDEDDAIDKITEKKGRKKDLNDPFLSMMGDSDSEEQGDNRVDRRDKREMREKEKREKKATKSEIKKMKDAERQELDLLMMDSAAAGGADSSKMGHFDINQIVKSQKKMSKAKRSKRNREEFDGLQENFELDADDSRFSSIYNSSEFAIDPNAKDFKRTKGMQKLLKERRSRQNADFQ